MVPTEKLHPPSGPNRLGDLFPRLPSTESRRPDSDPMATSDDDVASRQPDDDGLIDRTKEDAGKAMGPRHLPHLWRRGQHHAGHRPVRQVAEAIWPHAGQHASELGEAAELRDDHVAFNRIASSRLRRSLQVDRFHYEYRAE